MLSRLGQLTVRRRRLVLSLTALFLVTSVVVGTRAFGVLQGGGFEVPGSESERAAEIVEDRFGAGGPNVVLLATAPEGGVDGGAVAAAGAELTARVAAVPGVEQAASYWTLGSPPPLRSKGGDKALVLARVGGDDEEAEATLADIEESLAGRQGPLDVAVGGQVAVFADVTRQIEADLGRAETIAVPVTLLLLVGVFGGLVAASLPLFVGVIAVLGTFLTLFVLGSITDVSVYAINLTTALGLGLAIDYSLFVVSRFREELAAGRTPADAVVRTVETAGRTVLLSGLTVAASLTALLVFPQFFLRSFAYAGIAVVVLAVLAAIVALPALLAVVGHRVDSLRVLPRRAAVRPGSAGGGAGGGGRPGTAGVGPRGGSGGRRRPVPVATAVIALLVFVGSPFLGVRFGSPDDRVLPEGAGSRQVSDVLRSEFSGNSAESFPVVVEASPGAGPLAAYAANLSGFDGVARVEAASGTWAGGELVAPAGPESARYEAGDGAWLSVVPSVSLNSPEGERLVKDIRGLDTPFDTTVGGGAAELVDSKAAIGDRLPLAIGLIVVTTFVLLFLLSGSVLVPVKAVVLNVLSLTATFGTMVWIFQEGHLSGLLGFTATGFLDTSMPILMFCIAFGLSMDYEVFLLSRIKEEYDRTGDNTASVALGLQRTGRIVTAAALLMSVTFFAFGLGGVTFMKLFGLGLGLAVVMDATIIRGLLVPAFMRLAGDANWWAPRPLRRLHDRFGLRESDTPVATAEGVASALPVERELVSR